MTTLIRKGVRVIRRDGVMSFIKKGSRYVYGEYVTRLPLIGLPTYNGIPVQKSHFPWEDISEPTYESGLVAGIEKYVKSGDTIVTVGGGYGVTAVKSAQKVGNEGRVIVFEGSRTHVQKTRETARRCGVGDIVRVNHRIVGSPKSVYGNSDEAKVQRLQPSDLPECDVLELDCEGAEIDILQNLMQKPRVIFVESHGLYDASSEQIQTILEEMPYEIVSKEVADDNKSEFCVENDIYVLTAILQ
ncbi:FkbM family methyltransferase [Halobacteriaceae archaeon SHR40]|uniref:FkbM family methyltransferase n=1 Tax=Halovenus amylolytica TaxID=2500550 RepID=UPI000FE2D182